MFAHVLGGGWVSLNETRLELDERDRKVLERIAAALEALAKQGLCTCARSRVVRHGDNPPRCQACGRLVDR